MMDRLTTTLAPFDETTEVAPYCDYVTGRPGDHWFPSAMRRSSEHLRAGTGLKEYVPGYLGWSSHRSGKTHKQQIADLTEDATWAQRLGEAPTWVDVVRLHNDRYPDHESDPMHYDPETDRAYTISTYNPLSKWDYWSLRGPAQRIHFRARPHIASRRVDAGLLGDLDLEGMRDTAADTAAARLQGIIRERRETHPGQLIDIDESDYIARHRAAAVPTSSTLTLDGTWMDSHDYETRHVYNVAANEYIDSLPASTALVLVTYHI